MTTLDKATGVSFLVTGALLTAFGLFSIMGAFTGGIMTQFGLAEGEVSAGLLGLVVLVFYAVWMVACLVGGPLQALAGIRLLQGHPPATLHWLASVAGLAATVTVYCALPGLITFALGVATALAPRDDHLG